MATLTVEDGSGVSGANTYVDITYADAYFEQFGDTRWEADTVTTAIKTDAILKGMRYVEGLPWKGTTVDQDQEVQWPRSSVYDRDERLVDEDVVPEVVKRAQCEASVRSLSGNNLLQPDQARGGKIAAEQVAGISRAYRRSAPSRTKITVIDDLLVGYLTSRYVTSVSRA